MGKAPVTRTDFAPSSKWPAPFNDPNWWKDWRSECATMADRKQRTERRGRPQQVSVLPDGHYGAKPASKELNYRRRHD